MNRFLSPLLRQCRPIAHITNLPPPRALRIPTTSFKLLPPQPARRRYSAMAQAPSSEDGRDLIFVRALYLKATSGVDTWQRPKPQPILLSLWLKTSVALAGSTDHLPYSIHYGIVCKTVTDLVENNSFNSLEHLAESVSQCALGDDLAGEWVRVVIEKPRALLRADAAGIAITRRKTAGGEVVAEGDDRVFIKDLRLVTIIGVNPWERVEKQNVVINLTLHKTDTKPVSGDKRDFDPHYNFREVANRVSEHVEKSDYKTVEAFVTEVARECCVGCGISKVTVRAEKPSALTFAEGPGVEITREREFFTVEAAKEGGETHDVFLALGSNVGDRYGAINEALRELEKRGIKVKKTSNLYQSAPMYVEDQPTFLNGVCQVETTLSPEDLLATVKSIENDLGRVKTIEKGPRSIDLDILLYDNLHLQSPTLTIPHLSMLERPFVLKPLCDIAPNRAHPLTSTAFKHHLSSCPPSSAPLRAYFPLSPHAPPLDPSNPNRPTITMAVLNLTPDSFSDGGKHTHSTVVSTVQQMIANGAGIIDIGGQSTRPGAEDVGEAEELRRVLPAIKAIRAASITVPISVDTFRAEVARQAILAGADIVNDISAGQMDAAMLPTVADLACPIVLNHTRGTPQTMNALATYTDVVADVRAELLARVDEAQRAGVRRWNIILDPGLGFAKNMQQNLELLRRLRELTESVELPWLLGPSRKRFVGTVTGEERPERRVWGTAGAVAACVAGGADVVRVHDVEEMAKVVGMAGAIWRV